MCRIVSKVGAGKSSVLGVNGITKVSNVLFVMEIISIIICVVLNYLVDEVFVDLINLNLSFIIPSFHLFIKLLVDEEDLVVRVQDQAQRNQITEKTQNECDHDGGGL